MKTCRYFIVFIVLFVFAETMMSGQNIQIPDSLKKMPDTPQKIQAYLKFTQDFPYEQRDSVYVELMHVAKKIGDQEGLAKIYNARGVMSRYKSTYYKSIEYHKLALEIAEFLGNNALIIDSYNNMGVAYRRLDEFYLAMNVHMKALYLAEKEKNDRHIAYALNSVGNIQISIKNFDDAIRYFKRALEVEIKRNNQLGQAMNYHNMGEAYFLQEKLDSAEICYEQSMKINQNINQQVGIAICYNSLGSLEEKKGNHSKAIGMFNEALKINIATGDKIHIGSSYNKIGNVYTSMGNYQNAIDNYNKSLEINESIGSKWNLREANLGLSRLHSKLHNYEQALQYYIKHTELDNEMRSEKNRQFAEEMDVKYETTKKEFKIASIEKEKNLILWLGIAVVAIFILIVLLLLFRHRFMNQRKKLIEQRIVQLEQEKQLVATQAVLDGETAERTRLARDLHDGLGGMLSVVKLNLNDMRKGAALESEDVERFNYALGMLDESILELRRVAHNMMPDSLTRYGLKVSLTDFCNNIPNTEFRYYGSEDRLNSKLEVMVYRTAYELINNALKHAEAKHINVQIVQEYDRISLTVQDDGKGFDANAFTDGTGLNNIRNRVGSHNGQLDFWSELGKGAEISVEFQLLEESYDTSTNNG